MSEAVKDEMTKWLETAQMLLSLDQIVIPKAIALMRLNDKATLLISEIITDNKFKRIAEVKDIVAEYANDDDYLLIYADNNEKIANKMKKDGYNIEYMSLDHNIEETLKILTVGGYRSAIGSFWNAVVDDLRNKILFRSISMFNKEMKPR